MLFPYRGFEVSVCLPGAGILSFHVALLMSISVYLHTKADGSSNDLVRLKSKI